MRRKDREVVNIGEISGIIELCKTCHLAMTDGDMPYVVPLSFGYEINGTALALYFHSAYAGRKIDVLRNNASVCFEMSCEGEPIYAENDPCNSGYYFSSIIGFGKAEFVEDSDEKCHALSLIMKRQADRNIAFTDEQARSVCIFKVLSDNFKGKSKPKPE